MRAVRLPLTLDPEVYQPDKSSPNSLSPLQAPSGLPQDDAAILVEELKNQGNSLMRSGQHGAAELVYSRAIGLAPQAPALYANRSLARTKLQKPWEAVQDARMATQLSPQWAKGHARLGSALQAASKWVEAAASFERAAWLAASVEKDTAAAAEYEAADWMLLDWKAGCTGDLARRSQQATSSHDDLAGRAEGAALGDGTPTIADLPPFLVPLFLQYLDGDAASICSAACVSTAWHAAAKASPVWRIISVGALRGVATSPSDKVILDPSPLALRMTGDVFTRLATVAGPSLTWVNLSGAVYLTDTDLACLSLPPSPALRGLSLLSATDNLRAAPGRSLTSPTNPPFKPMAVTGHGVATALQGRKLEALEVKGIKPGWSRTVGSVLPKLRNLVCEPARLDVGSVCETCSRLVPKCSVRHCMRYGECTTSWCDICAVEAGGRRLTDRACEDCAIFTPPYNGNPFHPMGGLLGCLNSWPSSDGKQLFIGAAPPPGW